jgi:hypothetical protein
LKGASLPSFGAPEHPTDQTLEQVDRLIRQVGGEVETDGEQCRVPALAFVAGKVLDRDTPGFTNELRHAGLMDGMAARRVDADGADMLQIAWCTDRAVVLRCWVT